MRKTVFVFVLVLMAFAGCSKQQQEQKGQAYPGAAVVMSPEEIKVREQIAKQSPNNADAWISLGNGLMDLNRFSEAADAYQKALALDPKNVDVRVDRGTCLKNLGKPQLAIEEYRKALQINPNHIHAHRNMGVVLVYDLKDKKAGAREFEKYLELFPNAPDAEQVRRLIENLKSGK